MSFRFRIIKSGFFSFFCSSGSGSGGRTRSAQSCSLAGALFALSLPVAAVAAEVEHVEDLQIHTVFGTAGNNPTSVKVGIGADGGDYTALLKWNEIDPGLSSFSRANLLLQNLLNNSDGAFSIHQMLTDWDESTDFGTTFPVAGVDYLAQPVAAGGFNDANAKTDTIDIGKLVEAWVADPSLNKGIILVPRGVLNANYPTTVSPEIQITSHARISGLDSDDVRITTGIGLPTFEPNTLTPMEDAGISNSAPDGFSRDNVVLGVGLDGGAIKMALYKFGFGELFVENPTGTPVVTNALFDLRSIDWHMKPSTTLNVHRMSVDWDESTVTWNQFGAGGPVSGTHYEPVPLGSVVIGGGTPSGTVDITGTALDWLQNPGTNFGLIVVAPTATNQITLTASERLLGGMDGDDVVLHVGLSQPVPPPVIVEFQSDGSLRFQADDPGVSEYVIEEATTATGPWSPAVSRIPPTNILLETTVPLSHPDALLRVSGLPPTNVTISPVLSRTAPTSLAVYDDQGRMVRVLWTVETKGPGDDVVWDGRNEEGLAMPIGTYSYKAIQLPSTGVSAQLVTTVGNGIGSRVGNEGGVHGLDMSDVDVDASGNIYLSGTGHGMSMQKLDSAGNMVWIHRRPSGPQGKRTTSALGNGFVYGADPLHFFRVDMNTGNAVAWPSGSTEKNLSGIPPVIAQTYDRFGDAQELWVRPILEGAYWFPASLDGLNGWRRPYHPNVSLVNGEMPPKRIRGMTVLGNEVFLSYTLENIVEVRSGTTGDILRTIPLTAPAGIAADTANNKLFVIRDTDIITMDSVGGSQATIAANALSLPWGLAFNSTSNLLYATDLFTNASTGHTIRVFNALTGSLVDTFGDPGSLEGTVTATKLYAPLGIDVDSNGRILVTESLMHRLSIFSHAFVPDTAIHGGSFCYATFADPQTPETAYMIDGDGQGSVREYILNYASQTWTMSRFWFLGGPHPTRDIIGGITQGTHIRHIGGFTYIFAYEDSIKVFRIDPDRLTPVALIGTRYLVETQPDVYLPPDVPTIWTDQNGDEIATPGETQPATPAVENLPHLNLGSRYEDTFCDADGTLYWGTFKLPLFNQDTNGVLEYRWEDLEHYGTDLDGIQDAFVCVDADPADQRYYLVSELDNDLQQPGIGLHDNRTIDCYVRKYDPNGQIIWQTGSKAPTAHGPGEMYHPRGIETFEVGVPARRFIAVNDEPGIIHFWNSDGLYITTLLRDMSINHPHQNFFWDFWVTPKWLSDPLVSTFGEFWHMSAEVHPTTGKVYIYAQSHEGGQHMRVFEILGLEGISETDGPIDF